VASLDNSSRSILQATYAPVAVDATKSADEGRAVEKHSFLASIQINTDEIKRVRQAVANDGIAHYEGFSASADEVQLALDACERLAAEQDARAPLLAAPFLAAVKPAALIVVGGAIASDRSAAAVHTPSTSPADGNVALQTVETAMTKPEFDPGRVTRDLVTGFARSSQVEPVGFLHLERLMFTPSGIERGELVHSIPMAPEEEINVAHKEWSTTSEEFQRIDTDYEEQFSEIGVAEKSELAQATSSQHQHSSGLNTGVTASGSYGPVTVTASLSTNAADSASASEQASRNVSASTTRKASKRSQQEHKVSFKVASAAGTQDEAVRRIRNPFTDKAVRFDYYQLVRKWKVDLYRYGIRLTFDLTIPDPGAALFARIEESQAIAATLEEGFGSPDATEPWAKFSVRPSDLRRDNYLALAAEYGASVPSPPEEFHTLEVPVFRKWNNFDETRIGDVITVEFDVPEGYALSEKIAQRYMVQQFEGDEEGPRIWDDSAEPANVGDSRKIVLQIVVKRAALY
jgi:hypothetical protein